MAAAPRRVRPGRGGTVAPWVLFASALLVLSGAWALAGPRFSAPDEPAHFLKAASVVRGQLRPPPDPDGEGQLVTLSERFAQSDQLAVCFAFRGQNTADCAPEDFVGSEASVEVATQAGSYPPLYYALVGWPTLISQDADVLYAMRLVGAVANVALLVGGTLALATVVGRRLAMGGMLVVATPMVVFLGGSVNPNGLEAGAAIATWCCALAVADRCGRGAPVGARLAWGLAVAGGALAATRWLGPAFLAVVLGGVALARPLRPLVAGCRRAQAERHVAWAAAALGAVVALSVAHTVLTPDRVLLPGAPVPPGDGVGEAILGNSEGYLRAMIGWFGWLDVPTPTFTYWVWLGLLGTLIGTALLVGGRAAARSMVLVALATVLLPYSQLPSADDIGLPWQGRYALPVAVGVPLVALVALAAARQAGRLEVAVGRLVLVLAPLAAAGHLVAFYWAQRRYATGTGGSLDILRDALWDPPGGNGLLLATAAASLAVLVAVALGGGGDDGLRGDEGSGGGQRGDGRQESGPQEGGPSADGRPGGWPRADAGGSDARRPGDR